jgi:hypothetical protein
LKRKTFGPPVYQHGLFELSIEPSYNSLDNTFKGIVQQKPTGVESYQSKGLCFALNH